MTKLSITIHNLQEQMTLLKEIVELQTAQVEMMQETNELRIAITVMED